MRYYILTTVKFANECIEFKKYGSTNSNWLANINIGDTIFISQFNFKSQNIYGPFKVTMSLFYDKKIIFPSQKYYYRIKIEYDKLQHINETDLYLNGVYSEKRGFAFKLICLLQQNKHLHSICLNNQEGEFISDTIKNHGDNYESINNKDYIPEYDKLKVDQKFITEKNKLYKKLFFSSESDLEAFIILCLKSQKNTTYNSLNNILNILPKNELNYSTIYNQFIFGNAYPSDIVIFNEDNTNILELKKTGLEKSMIPTIEKEIVKYCTYSLYSDRLETNQTQMNFFLIVLKNENNIRFKKYLEDYFQKSIAKISNLKKNNFMIIEYYIENQDLLFRQI
jgi:signal peptidase I